MGILNEWKSTDDSGKFIPHTIVSNGGNPVSASNPLPTTATVTVDTMSLTAELSEASSHDYYVTTTNLGDGTDTIGFDAVAGLALADIVKVENKTQGCVYVTAGATVTTTAIELDMTKQPTGTPVPGATDEFEIVYRGASRLTDKTQMSRLTDGTTEAVIETAGTKKALNVNVTDGTNDMPTMDINTRAGFVKVTDGTQDGDLIVNSAAGDSATKLGVASEVVDFDTTASEDFTGAIGVLASTATGAKPIQLDASNQLIVSDPYNGALLNSTNLNAVTTATDGASVETALYGRKTVYVNVSVNTGAVTVNIEISPDNTNWYEYDSKIYTGVTALDSWAVDGHFPYMRTTTTTQSNATVTTVIQGRGL